jgi:RNase P/RNase MRP subunit POP5
MRALKPSHREHKRYLLIEGKDANKKEIEEAILKFIGILGYAKASPSLVGGENAAKKKGIVLAINRSELEKVRSAFLLSGKDIRILRVSGMINKL